MRTDDYYYKPTWSFTQYISATQNSGLLPVFEAVAKHTNPIHPIKDAGLPMEKRRITTLRLGDSFPPTIAPLFRKINSLRK